MRAVANAGAPCVECADPQHCLDVGYCAKKVHNEPSRCSTCGRPLGGFAVACSRPGCASHFYEKRTDAAPSILDEAAALVHGDRQAAYGHPSENHACTAELWNTYLSRRADALDGNGTIDAFDVCMLNILQKVSRLAHSRTRDSLVDVAGFAANADMVEP